VIQRKQPRAFGQREVVLAASVTAPILFALATARARERDRHAETVARTVGRHDAPRPHHVVLRGQGTAPGSALGTACVRTLPPVAATGGARLDVAAERSRLTEALVRVADEIARLDEWAAGQAPLTTMSSLLWPARYVLDDARLRGRMLAAVDEGDAAGVAVERVMREYTRHLTASGDPLLVARALEVEQLCLRVRARLERPAAVLPPGSVLVAGRLTVCDALELAAAHGTGAVLVEPAGASPGIAVLIALGLPVVAGVSELYRWTADGDRLLIDGEAGTITVNPSRIDELAFRRAR
jgi:signal transduction protein with GAF and PtsI domain